MAQASPDTLLFLVTAALGAYFISASFPTVNAFLLAQFEAGALDELAETYGLAGSVVEQTAPETEAA